MMHTNVWGWTDHLADGSGFGGNLYKLTRWDHAISNISNGHFDLVRNDAFWGQRPRLREIRWTHYAYGITMWNDYLAGMGDQMPVLWGVDLSRARAMPGFHEDPYLILSYLTLNWRRPPFDDVRVRQAFFLAIDRQHNAHEISHDEVAPSIHLVPRGMLGYNPDLRDPAGRTDAAALTADPARASQLWQAYLDENDGGDASKAPEVRLVYGGGSVTLDLRAHAFKQEWEAAMPGVRITIVEASDMCMTVQARGLNCRAFTQLLFTGSIADYPDPYDILSLYARTDAACNKTGVSVPAADALMDQADKSGTPAERAPLYQQAEQALIDAVAWVPLAQPLNRYLVRTYVAGNYHERDGGIASLAAWQRIYLETNG